MTLRDRISLAWRIEPHRCEPLPGGMMSRTWTVHANGERYVAKLVPPDQRTGFVAGLAAAEHLASVGIATGTPVRTVDDRLADDETLALLRYVPGRMLDRHDPAERRRWGELLGAVHRALDGFTHPGLTPWHWVRPDAPHLDVEPWVRPAVTRAVEELATTHGLTHGVIHADPAPDAFLLDETTGRVGLIDWGATGTGPLMYDVASAVMYAGRPAELVDAYGAAGPLSRAEIDTTLPILLRFRWAVQADYFARRIEVDDRTGIADPAENWAGLHHARTHLT